MAKISKFQIIDDSEILPESTITGIEFSESIIKITFDSGIRLLENLARYRLINNKRHCVKCTGENVAWMSLSKRKQSPDGYCWYCLSCYQMSTIRQNSIFETCRTPVYKLLLFFYKYINGDLLVDASFECNIERKTAGRWGEFLRDVIVESISKERKKIGGLDEHGHSKFVEIDESLFFKAKYNRGRMNESCWFVGGVERGSKNIFIVPVENRNTDAILNVIKENVLPGTTVITDQWLAYQSAIRKNPNYSHLTVNHSLYFVDPANELVHTQNIEGLWSVCKNFLRNKKGIKHYDLGIYIAQFMWAYKLEKRERFSNLLVLISSKMNNC